MSAGKYRKDPEKVRSPDVNFWIYHLNYIEAHAETNSYFPHFYFFPNTYFSTSYDEELWEAIWTDHIVFLVYIADNDYLMDNKLPHHQPTMEYILRNSNSIFLHQYSSKLTHGNLIIIKKFQLSDIQQLKTYVPLFLRFIDVDAYPGS